MLDVANKHVSLVFLILIDKREAFTLGSMPSAKPAFPSLISTPRWWLEMLA